MNTIIKITLKSLVITAIVAVVTNGLFRITKVTNQYAAILQFLTLFTAYLILAIWLAKIFSNWLGEKVGSLFWPREEIVPPPLYYLIDFYIECGDLNRALFEYEKVLHYHPKEIGAHLGRLQMMAALSLPAVQIKDAYLKSLSTLELNGDLLAMNTCYERYLGTQTATANTLNPTGV